MKTAEEILNEVYENPEDIQLALVLNSDVTVVKEAMRKYALEAIKEDRKQLNQHITFSAYYEPEDWDELVEEELEEEGNYTQPFLRNGKVIFVNNNSITNAPLIELK